jgi:hypothetical protein
MAERIFPLDIYIHVGHVHEFRGTYSETSGFQGSYQALCRRRLAGFFIPGQTYNFCHVNATSIKTMELLYRYSQ